MSRKSTTIYALYKGEKLIKDGTAQEIADYMGVKVKSIMFYQTPTYLKRTSEECGRRLVKLDD